VPAFRLVFQEKMMKLELWQAFVLGTVLAWGVYVPVLHEGQRELGGGKPGEGSVRAFLCVGLAYLLTAVVIPLILMAANLSGGEKFTFTTASGAVNWSGIVFATLGGVAGAAGALGIILAIKSGGRPLYIVPLVFAGAPIVSSIVALLWHPPQGGVGWMFFAGIILAAAGAGLVLYSKGQADMQKAPSPGQAALIGKMPGATVSQHH
jgi:hypothetical protein